MKGSGELPDEVDFPNENHLMLIPGCKGLEL